MSQQAQPTEPSVVRAAAAAMAPPSLCSGITYGNILVLAREGEILAYRNIPCKCVKLLFICIARLFVDVILVEQGVCGDPNDNCLAEIVAALIGTG